MNACHYPQLPIKLCGLLVLTALLPLTSHGSIFNVTNLSDSGAGSLRDAITQAEANAGADQINFQVGGTIDVASVFPTITTDISISSNGFGVTLDGGNGGHNAYLITSGGTLGLADFTIQNFFSGVISGGAIRMEAGVLNVSGSTFTNNSTDRTGGAIRIQGGATANVQNSSFTQNSALQGGAVSMTQGTLNLRSSQITNNTAELRLFGIAGLSGGISAFDNNAGSSSITIEDSNVSNNTGERSNGGIFIRGGTLDISNSSINDNDSLGSGEDGGGLQIAGGAQVTITDSEVNGNTADGSGGGIHTQNPGTSLTLERTTVDGNTALTGGGINSADADLTIIQSTISNNEATQAGGGGINANRGQELFIENSTISGNTSATGGGGMVVSEGVSGEVVSTTFAFNTSGNAGAAINFTTDGDTTLEVQNSIFSDNNQSGTPSTISGPVTSGGNNLFDNDGGGLIDQMPSDQFNADADLQPLADNGGPTFTHALGATSDAIDTGATNLNVDQRGFVRNVNAPDVGSFEFGAVPEPSSAALLVGAAALLALRRRREFKSRR
ncbi:MAG: choice-of-anchor Q domain-containing protein [Verrucomicrobiota bacterium]